MPLAQLRALAVELSRTEERERRRLAQLLNEQLQQLLVGARFNLGTLSGKLRTKMAARVVQEVLGALDEAIRAVRSLTADFNPAIVREQGLAAALGWLCTEMKERIGFRLEARIDPDAEPVEYARELLFATASELLRRIAKQGRADRAVVSLDRRDDAHVALTLSYCGPGIALAWTGAHSDADIPLGCLYARLRCLGGTIELTSTSPSDHRVTLVAPLR